jgi:hypothetical protein
MTGANLIGMGNVLDLLDYDEFGEVRYVVGTNVRYSIYVEYGTSSMEAQPYLRPAIEDAIRSLDTHVDDADSPEELAEQLALHVEKVAKDEVPVDTGNLKNSIEAERIR